MYEQMKIDNEALKIEREKERQVEKEKDKLFIKEYNKLIEEQEKKRRLNKSSVAIKIK